MLALELEVTVAINVTAWLVTADAGDASSDVVVGCDAAGVGAATTVVVLLLFTEVLSHRVRSR